MSDKVFVVVGHWPDFGKQFWRDGLFESPEDAREAFDDYCAPGNSGDILEATFVEVVTVELP